MDSFEFNKYAGAVLMTVLAFLVIGYVGNFLVDIEPAAPEAAAAKTSAELAKAAAKPPAKAGESGSALALLASADVAAGKKLVKKCTACHSLDKGGKNKIGPNLWNIVGAEKARVAGYKYSKALSAAGGAWSWDALDAFIANPKAALKGTKMSFAGVKKAQQRADLLAYLRSLSDSPKPLP